MSDQLVIGGKSFNSRLILGTGRYRNMEDMVQAVEASGTEMNTVGHPPPGPGRPHKEDYSRLH